MELMIYAVGGVITIMLFSLGEMYQKRKYPDMQPSMFSESFANLIIGIFWPLCLIIFLCLIIEEYNRQIKQEGEG